MKFGKMGIWLLIMGMAIWLAATAYAADTNASVSPGLEVLASSISMKKTGLVNNDIGFEAADFERMLNVSAVSAVTVTELPSRSDGVLYLGGGEVSVGQVISRENIGRLCFVFEGEAVQNTSFRFSTNHGSYDMVCSMQLLSYQNVSPTVSSVSRDVLAVSTYCDVAVYGKLDAFDPDGDDLIYEVIEYPKNGILIMEDIHVGAYRYLPFEGYTGQDSFRYVVCDEYGAYSASALVNLKVSEQKDRLVYADMEESRAHVSAISLTERGIMTASVAGDKSYFEPSKSVSRIEFLVAAMKTLESGEIPNSTKTVFDDDGKIPSAYKGYVNYAVEHGYICGKIGEDGGLYLDPDAEITRAEAAVILTRMRSVTRPLASPVFADSSSIPAWASEAVAALAALDVLEARDGRICADASLTRAEQARMLYTFGKLS